MEHYIGAMEHCSAATEDCNAATELCTASGACCTSPSERCPVPREERTGPTELRPASIGHRIASVEPWTGAAGLLSEAREATRSSPRVWSYRHFVASLTRMLKGSRIRTILREGDMRFVMLLGVIAACLESGCTLRGALEMPASSLAALGNAPSVFVKSEPGYLGDIIAQEIVDRLNQCGLGVHFSGASRTADVLVDYEEEFTGFCLDDCDMPAPGWARATIRLGQDQEFHWSATRSPLCTSDDCLRKLFTKQLAQTWCGSHKRGA